MLTERRFRTSEHFPKRESRGYRASSFLSSGAFLECGVYPVGGLARSHAIQGLQLHGRFEAEQLIEEAACLKSANLRNQGPYTKPQQNLKMQKRNEHVSPSSPFGAAPRFRRKLLSGPGCF